jgi:hypothetical protein
MNRYTKSYNKENIIPDSDRLSSHKKYMRSELTTKNPKKQILKDYRNSLNSLKLYQDCLPMIAGRKK